MVVRAPYKAASLPYKDLSLPYKALSFVRFGFVAGQLLLVSLEFPSSEDCLVSLDLVVSHGFSQLFCCVLFD